MEYVQKLQLVHLQTNYNMPMANHETTL